MMAKDVAFMGEKRDAFFAVLERPLVFEGVT